jgi:hypothetical protein
VLVLPPPPLVVVMGVWMPLLLLQLRGGLELQHSRR